MSEQDDFLIGNNRLDESLLMDMSDMPVEQSAQHIEVVDDAHPGGQEKEVSGEAEHLFDCEEEKQCDGEAVEWRIVFPER